MTEAKPDGPTAAPVLRIVRGNPTPEDIAVLTALAAARSGDPETAPRARRGGWSDPGRQHRRLPAPGPNGWRSAAW